MNKTIFYSLLFCYFIFLSSCSLQSVSQSKSQRFLRGLSNKKSKLYFLSPVARLNKTKISQAYRTKKNKRHEGIDFTGFRGAAITASHSGRVIYAGRRFSGYGRLVLIEYNKKWASLYAHLNSFRVKTGQRLKAGQIIGTMGSSGKVSGVHLHFELLRFKQPVNPKKYLFFRPSLAKK